MRARWLFRPVCFDGSTKRGPKSSSLPCPVYSWYPCYAPQFSVIVRTTASPLRRPRRRRTQLVQQRRVKPRSYWNPSLQLSLWFVAYLDAIEAGVITADQIPPESGLNAEVIAALKVVEDWDLSDEWRWCNTAVGERGEYPIFQAHLARAAQCREVEADGPESESC